MVKFYNNIFMRWIFMEIIKELQDYRYLNWSKTRHSSGTAGTLLKAEEIGPEGKIYYKLSRFDSQNGIIGHEAVNELIVDRLLTALDIPHLSYDLIRAQIVINNQEFETYINKSYDYKIKGEKKTAFESFYLVNKYSNETAFEFANRYGWKDYIYQMFIVDYLILNRDRHGANIEVLKNKNSVRLAPLFDHGLSLLFDVTNPDALNKNDLLEDKKVMDFIGKGSTLENLASIPKEYLIPLPSNKKAIINGLFEGLDDVLTEAYIEKIAEMISERWAFYEVFRNKK